MIKTKSIYYSSNTNGKPAYISISGEGENKDSWKATEIKVGDTAENAKCVKDPQDYTLTDCDNIFTTISSMFPNLCFEDDYPKAKCDGKECKKIDGGCCKCYDSKPEDQKVKSEPVEKSKEQKKPNRLQSILESLYDGKKDLGSGITIDKNPPSIIKSECEDKVADFKKPESKKKVEDKIPAKKELTADEKILAFQGSFTKALHAEIIEDLERDLGVKLDYVNILTLSLGSVLVQLTPITKNPHKTGIKIVEQLDSMKFWYGKKYSMFSDWFKYIQYWSNYDKDHLICGIQFNLLDEVY